MKIILAAIFLSAGVLSAEQNAESKQDMWTQAQIEMIKKSVSDLEKENNGSVESVESEKSNS